MIQNNLIKTCKLPYSKYKIALEQKKDNTKASEKDKKQKLKMDEIVKVKKQRLLHCA